MNEPPVRQAPLPQKIKTEGQHYASPLHAVHGPAPGKPAAVEYTDPEVRDLYERLRKLFAEMGHEF